MEDKTKIVFLLDSLKRGGVQNGVLLQSSNIDKTKYDIEVWALRSNDQNWEYASAFKEQAVSISPVPVKHYTDTKGIIKLAEKLSKEKIVILNTESFYPNIVGRIAAYLAETPIVIVNYHSTYKHRWNPKYIAYEKMLRDITDNFVCVSGAVEDYLTPLLNLPKNKLYKLYNCVDIEKYIINEPKNSIREKLSLPLDTPIVAMIGRLTKVKNIPLLFKALPEIKKEIPNIKAVLVGDGEDRQQLEKEVDEKNLRDTVIFMGSREDVPMILNAVDCIALPSEVEGFPRVLLEAFAAKTPLIATPAGGIAEILKDGINGLLIPFSDSQSLADAVKKTLLEKEDTLKRCEMAFDDVQEFSLKNWINQTEELFDKLIDQNKSEIEKYLNTEKQISNLSMKIKLLKFRAKFNLHRFFYK